MRAETVVKLEAEVDVGADLRINVVVGAVVLVLFNVAAFKVETGMLTSVPV